MTHTLGIISSSVVNEADVKRLQQLEDWAVNLTAMFALYGAEASMCHHYQGSPEGFAQGMNAALLEHRQQYGPLPDYVLCINDDLHVDEECIKQLWKHRNAKWVTCPTTDYTSCPEQQATGPLFEIPRPVAFCPAIAWLMPRDFVVQAQHVLGKHQLFDESLGRAWFEDNLSARIFARYFDPRPFLIAPTAWAHHEGSRTSNAIPEAERWAAKGKFEARCQELQV